MRELHRRCGALPGAGLHEQEGEVAGISFRVHGAGPPLVLLPLDLLPVDSVGPHARHQRVFGNDRPARLDERQQHVKGATAELDRPAVGEQLAAIRRQQETPERDPRRCFGNRLHESDYRGVTGNHRFFQGCPARQGSAET